MRRKTHRALAILTLLAAVVMVMGALARERLQHNRLRYLVNDHRYLEALVDYDELRVGAPDGTEPIEGFAAGLLERAHDYYHQFDLSAGSPAEIQYLSILDEVGQRHPRLASQALRLRLELLAGRDGPAPATLAAARAVLEHGYDERALWWAARCQFDPSDPLRTPPELIQWRGLVDQPTPTRSERLRYLDALLALSDRDWSRAASIFDADPPAAGLEDAELAHGLALLRSGRPEDAIPHLRRDLQRHPERLASLQALLEGLLAIGQYHWALPAALELAAAEPTRLEAALRAVFPAVAGATDPLAALLDNLKPATPADIELWDLLARLAPADLARADAAAQRLLAQAEPRTDALARLTEAALWREDAALLGAIEERLAIRPADPAVASLRTALAGATGGNGNPAAQTLNLYLSRNATRHAPLTIPEGARVALFHLQGFPAGALWPVLHLELDALASRAVYAIDTRARPRPLLMLLPADAAGPATLAVSLLNAPLEAEAAPGALIVDVTFY